jgi:hypothetical protein
MGIPIGEIGQMAIEKKLDESEALYLIEVHFTGMFSIHQPNQGIVSLWERTPIGYSNLYRCSRCDAVIPTATKDFSLIGIVCDACSNVMRDEDLVGQTYYKMIVQKWADRLVYYLHQLQLKADLLLTRGKSTTSIIEAEFVARASFKGAALLDEAKRYERAMYSMDAINKDVSAGRDLTDTIKAFLVA